MYGTSQFRTITASKAGTCKRCGQSFPAGTRVRWAPGRTYHLRHECSHEPTEEQRAAAEERANLAYWERVDNYRELGYDPN